MGPSPTIDQSSPSLSFLSSCCSLSSLNNPFVFHMAAPGPIPTGKPFPDFASSAPPSSVWERISTWASENKAVVYAIAGVAVVVSGAGVAYYLTDSKTNTIGRESPKKPKKEKRRKKEEEKKAADLEKGTVEPKPTAPTVESVDELPEVDETTVGELSEQNNDDPD